MPRKTIKQLEKQISELELRLEDQRKTHSHDHTQWSFEYTNVRKALQRAINDLNIERIENNRILESRSRAIHALKNSIMYNPPVSKRHIVTVKDYIRASLTNSLTSTLTTTEEAITEEAITKED